MALINIAKRNKEGEKKPTRYYSKKQEKHVAETLDGKLTKNSGATQFGGKGDVNISGLFSIECKTRTTDKDSISIKKEWLEKIRSESLFDGKPYYSLAFNFGPGDDMYYIIDEKLFEELIELLRNK